MRYREEKFVATAPNQAWSIDFVADQLQDGRRFRSLTIVDTYRWFLVRGEPLKEAEMIDPNSPHGEVHRRISWCRGQSWTGRPRIGSTHQQQEWVHVRASSTAQHLVVAHLMPQHRVVVGPTSQHLVAADRMALDLAVG